MKDRRQEKNDDCFDYIIFLFVSSSSLITYDGEKSFADMDRMHTCNFK